MSSSLLEQLAQFTTPTVLNGLKQLGVRPEDLRTTDSSVRCMSPALGPRLGHVATMKVETRPAGDSSGVERNPAVTNGLNELILSLPQPRVLVVENVGRPDGPACIWGEVMANLYRALGCSAGITNGPVRDLPEMEAAGFVTFARGLAVGGGFVRPLEVGTPVTVAGLVFEAGDLVHADMHGVLKLPPDLIAELPAAIAAVETYERTFIDACRSSDFSLENLSRALATVKH